ncbi:uncharacterized protein LOC119686436 [Teleopsis dalmanni]|uniref:uncharacterized protein LOC119686436 n=1 Tax=Teleopsis dalmanni TaxID=139649 RepID=UPI0018CE4B51|nr:uncharacterized protein LOC119686436 [Teleopsis dalmanni]
MSHLLKRTKKTCLKLLRKLSSKTSNAEKLDEEPEHVGTIAPQYTELQTITKNSSNNNVTKPLELAFDNDIDLVSEDEFNHFCFDSKHGNSILQSLTSKLFLTADGYEFHRLHQLRSDTTSDILQFENNFDEEIVFEKVKYREDIKYFRHSPSNCSLDNTAQITFTPTPYHLSDSNSIISNNSTDDNLHFTPYTSKRNKFFPMNFNLDSSADDMLAVRDKVSKPDDEMHTYKMAPVFKWDINGNPFDATMYNNDNWSEYDFRLNKNRGKRFSVHQSDESQKSSFRSSSTTLETWIEDEQIGNSFHEQIGLHSNFCLTTA